MDESVKLFEAEQRRIAEAGGAVGSLKRQITNGMIAVGAFATIVWALMAGLGALPPNPDHSVKLIYYGSVLIGLSALAAFFLRTEVARRSPLRFVAWSLIGLTGIAITVGVVDLLTRNGG